jgi:serine/threonine protein kinase
MEPAEPGRLIAGRYRLSAVIGRGGMGVVWRSRDELLGRDVAVKELAWPAYSSAAEQQAACRRAIREAQVTAQLNHHNVIRVFDIVEDGGCPWIVMELLPYRTLHGLIQEEGPLSPAAAAEVGLGILAALRVIHAKGIVHLDVKPANILMAPDRVVLTDFGIARAAGTSASTAVGELIGSPSYIAPERAWGGQSGPPGDLWGLGASLYAAVEGHAPFDRDGGALASLTAVVADEPESATHAGPLWPVISGLLRKDPGRRLNAVEAERMLRGIGVALPAPVSAALPAPVSAATPRPRRPRAPSAAFAGSAALAVIAVSGSAAWLTLTSTPRHEPAPASTPLAASTPTTSTHPSAPSTHPSATSTHPSATSTHPSATSTHPGTYAMTGRTAHTRRARPSRSPSSRPTSATTPPRSGNTGNGAASHSGLVVRVGDFVLYIPD